MEETAKTRGENLAQLTNELASKGSDLEPDTGGRPIQSQNEHVYRVEYSLRFRIVLTQLRSVV